MYIDRMICRAICLNLIGFERPSLVFASASVSLVARFSKSFFALLHANEGCIIAAVLRSHDGPLELDHSLSWTWANKALAPISAQDLPHGHWLVWMAWTTSFHRVTPVAIASSAKKNWLAEWALSLRESGAPVFFVVRAVRTELKP